MAVPYDLSITCSHEKGKFMAFSSKDMRQKLLSEAVELGYKHIGLDYTAEIIQTTSKKNKPIQHLIIPDIEPVSLQEITVPTAVTIHQRVTIPLPASNFIHSLNSPSAQKFDLVAVDLSCADDKLFTQACAELHVDIIVLNVLNEKSISGKKVPSLKMALKRGVCLEIKYASAVVDSTVLLNFISLVANMKKHRLTSMLIVSSGAINANQIRSPEGIRDLIMASDLNNMSATACLSTNCSKAIKHGIARKSGVMGAVFSWTVNVPNDQCAQCNDKHSLKRSVDASEVVTSQAGKIVKFSSS